MVQLSPDTRVGNWDACSGYHYSDSGILGFTHTQTHILVVQVVPIREIYYSGQQRRLYHQL